MNNLDKKFWSERYASRMTGWDIGYASPPIMTFAETQIDKTAKILIPGCGYGHEAVKLEQLGYSNVTVLDIAEQPLHNLRNRLKENSKIHLVQSDFFHHSDEYDFILEQTFFCALNPARRKDYVHKTASLLKKNGTMAGVLFNVDFAKDHPPFGGSKEEYLSLFSPLFEIKVLEKCYNSIPPRMGNELFFNFMPHK